MIPSLLRLGLRSALCLPCILVVPAACAAEPNEPSSVTWGEVIEVASGEAHRGPWRMNESDFRFVDDPTVAIDQQSTVAVAWADQARQDIFVQLYTPEGERGLDEPVNVSRSGDTFSWLPRVMFSEVEPDTLYMLWQEIVFSGGSHGGEIFFARSTDGGATFSELINLSNTIAGAGKGRLSRDRWHNGSLDLAEGPDGTLYAAWSEYEGRLRVSRSTDGGERFDEPVQVVGEAGDAPARGPSLAVDGEGIVHLAWTVGEQVKADIHYAASADRGASFAAPQRVAESSGHADAPKLAADGAGTVHLVYAESADGSSQRYRILYTRLSGGAEAFEPPRTIAGPQMQQAQSAGFPSLALDGAGNVYLTWELFPDARSRPQGLGFACSPDGGDSFTAPTRIPGIGGPGMGHNGSQQGLLMNKLAVSPAGAIAVVNSTFQPDQASHIRLIRRQVEHDDSR